MKKILLPLVFGALAFPVFGCGNAALPPKAARQTAIATYPKRKPVK